MTSPVKSNTFICLRNNKGQYLTSFSKGLSRRYNWPKLTAEREKKIPLQILRLKNNSNESGSEATPHESKNELRSGDRIKLKTSEARAGDNDTLGKFYDSIDCYYWKDNYDPERQGWIVTKVSGSEGETIRYGDQVTLTNISFVGQKLAADTVWNGYITIKAEVDETWVFEEAPSREPGENEWLAYYDQFPYFSPAVVRPGCYPRILEHNQPVEKAIVLVHGLTDSPYFMTAIAHYFHNELGYNVYLPLLQGHGLLVPSGMEGVSLEEWKSNVQFAVKKATENAKQVSIGGLSTGGTLSCYEAMTNDVIQELYLFSAALDIAGSAGIGNLKEYLLRTFLADMLDSTGPLIGENPYRYARMDNDGARVLSEQIEEVDRLLKETYSPHHLFSKPIFAAHSECDTAADIQGIEALRRVCNLDQFRFFRIPEKEAVSHASLVLKDPVLRNAEDIPKSSSLYYRVMIKFFDWLEARLLNWRNSVLPEVMKTKRVDDPVLEAANPVFDEMMNAIARFDQTLATSSQQQVFQLQALRDRLNHLADLQEYYSIDQSSINSILSLHQKVLADPTALVRYATIAQTVYGIESNPDAYLPDVELAKLNPLGCRLIAGTALDDTSLFNGLQAMCLECDQGETKELIVAYRGTNNQKVADLLVDAGIAAVLGSITGDDYVRRIIQDAMQQGGKAPMQLSDATVSGQIAARLINARFYLINQVKSGHIQLDQYNKITVVGHSLGGLIAAHIAYWASEEYQKEINCHTFNAAPGAKYTLVESNEKCDRAIAHRIINHRIVGDSVSAPPPPIDTDSEGFPYAHLGYIYNWRPLKADSLGDIAVHSLDRFITDLHCTTKHLVGISPAPIGRVYW